MTDRKDIREDLRSTDTIYIRTEKEIEKKRESWLDSLDRTTETESWRTVQDNKRDSES